MSKHCREGKVSESATHIGAGILGEDREDDGGAKEFLIFDQDMRGQAPYILFQKLALQC
jgi:hypothetical protein